LKEKVFPGVELNYKMAKFQLLKGIWKAKFDIDSAINDHLEAYRQFTELEGGEDNYFSACTLLEVGHANVRKGKEEDAKGFFFSSLQAFKQLF